MKFASIETAFRESCCSYASIIAHDSSDANVGVDEIVEEQRPFALRHPVSFGDLYVAETGKVAFTIPWLLRPWYEHCMTPPHRPPHRSGT